MKLFRIAMAVACAVPAFASGISFTCDSTIGADFDPGGSSTAVCNYLNTTVASLYNNTFTNANASIYIEATTMGLAGSTTGFTNLVPYSDYRTELQSKSTDAAKAFVPATEPGIFGTGGDVEITSALGEALFGNTGGFAGTTAGGSKCFTPGSGGCYNGIIVVNDPTDLSIQTGGQGYTYESLGGSTNGTADNYDFFAVVEHEVDEVLGTASCISLTKAGAIENDCGSNPSAVDLFRYSASGVRAYDSLTPVNQYFSPDGGITDLFGNLYNTAKGGEDWADFSQGCLFIQDAEACPSFDPSTNSYSILTDGPGGTVGPEVAILNAVGYNLVVPEPGTMGLLGFGLAGLGFAAYRRRIA